jgi:hypothetical protein
MGGTVNTRGNLKRQLEEGGMFDGPFNTNFQYWMRGRGFEERQSKRM